MPIRISKIRLKNFKSFISSEISLDHFNILIGANNCGKSNILRAVTLSLNQYSDVFESDIHWGKDEAIDRKKTAIIDIYISPTDSNNKPETVFNKFWSQCFTSSWIQTDSGKEYVGVRTVIKYDEIKTDYIIEKFPIKIWGDSIESTTILQKKSFTSDMVDYIKSFYIDASRDVSEDMRNKKSYFSKSTQIDDLSPEDKLEVEKLLSSTNEKLISSLPALKHVEESITNISTTLNSSQSKVSIEPIARKITDLHQGMDIMVTDEESQTFSIALNGKGTKSWASLLSLDAFVKLFEKKGSSEGVEYFIFLNMEEPEAHLHPQAQKKLLSQIKNFRGQKLITTHSPSIVSLCPIYDLIRLIKSKGETKIYKIEKETFDLEEQRKIKREIIRSKGELLFSTMVIMGEGVTEEHYLTEFFDDYFSNSIFHYGGNILGVGGTNFSIFIKFFSLYNIPWYIFSDGEKDPIKKLISALNVDSIEKIDIMDNVVYLKNDECIELHLVKNGYDEEIKKAMNIIDESTDSFEELIRKNPVKKEKDTVTGKKCELCKQDIKSTEPIDLHGLSLDLFDLYKVITRGKSKTTYSLQIAYEIVQSEKGIPPKVIELFEKINIKYNLIGGC